MNREYHLSFCKICNNRKNNLSKGLVCSLTNDVADFTESCLTFELDSSELQKFKKRFEDEVNDKYATNGFEKILSESSFTKPSKSRNPKYKSIENTHNLKFKNNVAYDKAILIFMIFTLIYIFFVNYNDIKNSTLENGVLAGFGVLGVLISVFFYRAYFMNFKTKISTTKKGIEYYGKHLNWNNIVDYGIVRTEGGRFNPGIIIVGTITKGIVEIDLTTLNIIPEDFIDIIRLNTKTLYNNIGNNLENP
ncbi:hypothetical protein [Algibacter lectus]|uniref:hypothetical protein n=1 Tax=Algibacter lectus TaxID=221126 RepID=UPI0026ED9D1B|nr:hypothetical protein [Algibacter lectus]MDO7135592.1 hypothetical protein [Algibacter lectus]